MQPTPHRRGIISAIMAFLRWCGSAELCRQAAEGRLLTMSRLQLRHLLVLIAFLVALILPIWAIREGSESLNQHDKFEGIGSVAASLVAYSEFHGRLPYPVVWHRPATELTGTGPVSETDRPLCSWRVEILGYLTSWHGSWDWTKAWDHPDNRQLLELSAFYAYVQPDEVLHLRSFPETRLLAITGPGTAFGDGTAPPRSLKDVPPQTILVVESIASGIPWPAPGDFDIRTQPQTVNAPDGKGISSRNAAGFQVIFADGQVWMLSHKIPFETLRKFFTTTGVKTHDREHLLGPFTLKRGL